MFAPIYETPIFEIIGGVDLLEPAQLQNLVEDVTQSSYGAMQSPKAMSLQEAAAFDRAYYDAQEDGMPQTMVFNSLEEALEFLTKHR